MMELIAYTHCDYIGWFIYILDFSYFRETSYVPWKWFISMESI